MLCKEAFFEEPSSPQQDADFEKGETIFHQKEKMKEEWIELGFCRKPHGVKGAFSFQLFNTDDSILKKGSTIQVRPLSENSSVSPDGENFEIQTLQFGNKVIATLKGVDNRNLVEEMLPFSIWADRNNFPSLEEGEIYLADLIGCSAIDEEGKNIGIVKNLAFNGIQDILVIDSNGKELEILFIDNFVLNVDMEKKEVLIRLPELI